MNKELSTNMIPPACLSSVKKKKKRIAQMNDNLTKAPSEIEDLANSVVLLLYIA